MKWRPSIIIRGESGWLCFLLPILGVQASHSFMVSKLMNVSEPGLPWVSMDDPCVPPLPAALPAPIAGAGCS
jgi:hypothetical protein